MQKIINSHKQSHSHSLENRLFFVKLSMSCVSEVLHNKKLHIFEVISRLHRFRGCCASLFSATQSISFALVRSLLFFFHKIFLSNWRGMGQKIGFTQGFYMTCRIWLASNAKPGISVTPDVTFPDFTQIMLGYSSSPEIKKPTFSITTLVYSFDSF